MGEDPSGGAGNDGGNSSDDGETIQQIADVVDLAGEAGSELVDTLGELLDE